VALQGTASADALRAIVDLDPRLRGGGLAAIKLRADTAATDQTQWFGVL